MNKVLICLALCFALAVSQQNVQVTSHPVGVYGDQNCNGVDSCASLLAVAGSSGIKANQTCQHNGYLWVTKTWSASLPTVKQSNYLGSAWNVQGVCQQLIYGGVVSPGSAVTDPINNEGPLEITITPNNNYQISKVVVNDNEVTSDLIPSQDGNSAVYQVSQIIGSPLNIDVYFSNKNGAVYDVYAQASDNLLSVSPDTLQVVLEGASQTFEVVPAKANCFVSNIQVNGVDGYPLDNNGRTFTIYNVQEAVSIKLDGDCNYKLTPIQPANVDDYNRCIMNPQDAQYVNENGQFTFHFDAPIPQENWKCLVGGIRVDIQLYPGDNEYTFKNVTQDHWISPECYCVPVNYDITFISDSCKTQQPIPSQVRFGSPLSFSVTSNCHLNSLSINGTNADASNNVVIPEIWGPTTVGADCTCLQLQDCPLSQWSPLNTYDWRYPNSAFKGKVTYEGQVYSYRGWSHGNVPSASVNSWDPWVNLGACAPVEGPILCSSVPAWDSSVNQYRYMQQVSHNGYIFAAYEGWNSNEPNADKDYSGWNIVSACEQDQA